MAKLTAAKRKALPKASFAVPRGTGSKPKINSYPIHDRSHARAALSMVAAHGTPTEQRMVKSAVKKRYPSIGAKKAASSSTTRTTSTSSAPSRRGGRRGRR